MCKTILAQDMEYTASVVPHLQEAETCISHPLGECHIQKIYCPNRSWSSPFLFLLRVTVRRNSLTLKGIEPVSVPRNRDWISCVPSHLSYVHIPLLH